MVKWNEVTWYSRLGALMLFVGVVPVISFYIGMQFQQYISFTDENVTAHEMSKRIEVPESKAKILPKDTFASPDGQYVAKEYSTEEIHDTYIEGKDGKEIVGRHPGSFRSWFPDSKSLLLYLAESPDNKRHMYILTVTGKYYDTGLPANTYDAAYRQNDGAIVYTLARTSGGDASDIFIRDANGVDRLLVKGDENIFIRLAWSSDGKKILFEKDMLSGNSLGIWEVNEDGTGLTRLKN